MAMKVKTYINNVLSVAPPQNHDEVEIELNFDRDKDTFTQTVTVNSYDYVKDLNDVIINVIDGGLTGASPGIFEGIPYKIEIESGTDIQKPFDGYIDLTDDAEISCNKTIAKVVEKSSIDWLNEVADSFTFEYLFKETGEITTADFYWMPYVLNSVPNYKEAAISLLSVGFIEQQIEAAIEKIAELGVEMANPFEASSIVRAVLFVAFLIILIASLIVLIKTIVLLIIQPVKYHAGMMAFDLCQKGAEHLGYTFASPDILETTDLKDLFILPQKPANQVNPSENKILGFTTPSITQEGYFKGTYGDLLRGFKEMFDAKIIVTPDKKIFLVKQNYSISAPVYQLPDLYQPFYSFNTNEFNANYLIEFATDLVDKNTIQNFTGTICQAICKPNSIVNPEMVLMKGIKQVSIPFALATRKETLTVPEEIIDAFLDVFDVIINGLIDAVNVVIDVYNSIVKVLNKIIDALDFVGINVSWEIPTITNIPAVNLSGLIDNRIGMLVLEIDSTSQPKVFLMVRGSASKFNKVYTTNRDVIAASWLYDNFHISNSFVPSVAYPNGNQYMKKSFEKVPFTFQNYVDVKLNNIIFDFTGNIAIIDYLKWNIEKQKAEMRVRFSQKYTNNLNEVILIPDGK
jgi:hypothetical protein